MRGREVRAFWIGWACAIAGVTLAHCTGCASNLSQPELTAISKAKSAVDSVIVEPNCGPYSFAHWSDRIYGYVEPCPLRVVRGDANGDGRVDILDQLLVIQAWSGAELAWWQTRAPMYGMTRWPWDLDGNNVVDMRDLLIVIAEWS